MASKGKDTKEDTNEGLKSAAILIGIVAVIVLVFSLPGQKEERTTGNLESILPVAGIDIIAILPEGFPSVLDEENVEESYIDRSGERDYAVVVYTTDAHFETIFDFLRTYLVQAGAENIRSEVSNPSGSLTVGALSGTVDSNRFSAAVTKLGNGSRVQIGYTFDLDSLTTPQ